MDSTSNELIQYKATLKETMDSVNNQINIYNNSPIINANKGRFLEIAEQLKKINLELEQIPTDIKKCTSAQKAKKAELIKEKGSLSQEYDMLNDSLQKIDQLKIALQYQLIELNGLYIQTENQLTNIATALSRPKPPSCTIS